MTTGRVYALTGLVISIHSLRVEGDFPPCMTISVVTDFNPLPPCGGRLCPCNKILFLHPISIHSLRVEGDNHGNFIRCCIKISIHSLRVEGDAAAVKMRERILRFQSTPSVWRETISHSVSFSISPNFNPLPPCGGRP